MRMAGYALLLRLLRRDRIFRDRTNPMDMFSESEFISRYRLSKATTCMVIDELRDQLQRQTRRNHTVTPEEQVFVFLRFLATGQFYNSIGDLHGFSKATVIAV